MEVAQPESSDPNHWLDSPASWGIKYVQVLIYMDIYSRKKKKKNGGGVSGWREQNTEKNSDILIYVKHHSKCQAPLVTLMPVLFQWMTSGYFFAITVKM